MHLSRCAVLVAVLLLSSCKSQRLRDTEAELAATRSRIAALETKRKELLAESKRLLVERKTHARQADEAELARNQLLAAAQVLGGQPIPDSILLDAALRSKGSDLGALAAAIVQRRLPCDSAADDEASEEPGPCAAPPLEDACVGVEPRLVQSLSWRCEPVAAAGLPTVALCRASGEWASEVSPVAVATPRAELEVLRLAFEHRGRLVVADWPGPELDLYRPPNVEELGVCEEANATEQCLRDCDVLFGRLPSCDDGWGGDGEVGEDDSDEPEEVRQARVAAEIAEQQAAEAREELQYQECRAPCERAPETEAPPVPDRVSLALRPERYPGLFLFDVMVDHHDDAGVRASRVLVLSFNELFEARRNELELPTDDLVRPLGLALDTPRLETLTGKGEVTLVGFDAPSNNVNAVVIPSAPGGEWRFLGQAETCQLVADKKLDALAKSCRVPPPPDAGAPSDGGVLDAGLLDAGEVTP